MKSFCLLFGILVITPCIGRAQTQAAPTLVPNSTFTANYPSNRSGIFIQNSDWQEIGNVVPFKTKAKHGIAASLSYGAVPAVIVSEYEGAHAQVQVQGGTPIICVCDILGLPGNPVVVRLHPKKNLRELDGGKMIVYPVVGGSKTADANKSDLVPVDISRPDSHSWLIRPQSPLAAGEYALMLGTQNVSIFPFTVTTASNNNPEVSENKK